MWFPAYEVFVPWGHIVLCNRVCYTRVMTAAKGRTKVGHYSVSETLTADEIAAINAKRAPKDKIKPLIKCTGRKPTTNEPCLAPAGRGTEHRGFGNCDAHGGNTPAGKKHAAHLMGLEIVEKQRNNILRFGGDRNDPSVVNITAEQALLEEVRRSVSMVRWLEEMIGQWDYQQDAPGFEEVVAAHIDGDTGLKGLPRLVTQTSRGVASTTDKAEWLKIYREEREQSAKVAKMCIDAGIAHRMVSIAEDQGRVLATALRAVLNLLSLTDAQAQAVPMLVPPILRAVASNTPLPPLVTTLEAIPEVAVLHHQVL